MVGHEMIDTRLLTWAAHLDVIVVFIAILRLFSNAQDMKDRSVTCDVPSVEPLANTSITCHFPENVSKTRRDVTVSFFKGMDFRDENIILECWWLSGKMECHVKPGYSFNRMISDTLTLDIHQVSAKHIGGYRCTLSNRNTKDSKICELKIKLVTSFCNISSVKETQPTSLTCTFNVDVNATKKNFSVVRFGGVDSKGVNIVICTWVKDQLNCTTAQGYEFNNTVKNHLVIAVPRASRDHTGKYACHVTGNKIDGFQPCAFILQQGTYTDVSNIGMILAIIVIMLIPVSLVIVILVFKFKRRVRASNAEDMQLLSLEEVGSSNELFPLPLLQSVNSPQEDKELWELEDWYPPLYPPETLKEDLLRDEDFTEVDKDARAKLDSPKDSFDKLVQHLTSHLSSNLHKLRAIFVWMSAQNIGYRQETGSCGDNSSPEYYLQEASKYNSLIGKMFAKMCRAARIPCVLVSGKVKGKDYETGDVDTKGQNTWAIVFVANSWRFVFPHWAFVVASGYQKEKLLIEESGKPIRTSLTANAGTTKHNFEEFYFLTDPEEMIYICHPYDKEKQLLTEPWTQEKFFESPHLWNPYFSSGWKLINPLTCVIKSTTGWCLIDMFSPGAGYKLNYKMFFDEVLSGRKFPQEIQTELYVNIIKQTQQTDSFLVRLPVTGTYEFKVIGAHGGQSISLVQFQIVSDEAAPDTQTFPSNPANGFGFGEAAAEAGLSEPSHTEGVVPVKSGDEVCMRFKVKDDVDILARLVHSTRTPEELRDNIIVEREDDNVTVTARLPADDPAPEYSIEVDTVKNIKENNESIKPLLSSKVLNYLLTSDETLNAAITDEGTKKNLQFHEDAWISVGNDDAEMLEKVASKDEKADIKDPMLDKKIQAKQTSYERMVEGVRVSVQEGNLDELNQRLEKCEAANLQNKGDIKDAKKILVTLFHKEMEKAFKSNNLEELRACLKKTDNSCVSKMARDQAWFVEGEEEIRMRAQTLRKKDEATEGRLPDHINDVIVAAFILIGESEEELDTWQKVNAKLKETNEEQLIDKVNNLENLSVTGELVDLAEQKLKGARGTFADYRSIETLKKQCLEKINFYLAKGSLKKRN